MSTPFEVIARPLSDCSALIVGGTSGVGLASAVQLAVAGVPRIALAGRNAERGAQARNAVLKESPNTHVLFVQGDANIIEQATQIVQQTQSQFGSVDILLNSTMDMSRYKPNPLHNIAAEDIGPIISQVVLAPMHMSRLVLPLMRERHGGVIINIASDAAKVPTPGETILGAAMAAIVVFSRTLAMEAKRFGVRVNVLTPSLIQGTPTAQHVLKDGFSAKLFERAAAAANLGVATPEDLASLVVYLSRPEAGRLTGQTISVNGGISAG